MRTMRNLLTVLVFVFVLGSAIHAEATRSIQAIPGLGGTYGVRYDQKVSEKNTWGGFVNSGGTTVGDIKIESTGLGVSKTLYDTALFEGRYRRFGVRYSSVKASDDVSSAEATLLIPYALVGYNLNILNVIIGAGIGIGYGFGSVTGDDVDYSISGITGMLDLNIGFKF